TELGPLRQHHAGIAAAGTATTDIGLYDGDIQGGLASFQLDGGPHAGETAADDADIGDLIALQRRTILLVRRNCLAQPDAAPLDPRLHGISRRLRERHLVPELFHREVRPRASRDQTAPSPARWWNEAGRSPHSAIHAGTRLTCCRAS